MELSELMAWLAEDDDASRPFRARRLKTLLEEFGEPRHLLLPGGLVSSLTFEEARRAYLHGLDVATVLLAQTTLEHMLGGLLRQVGHDGNWGFSEILNRSRREGLITEAEFDLFDRLRVARNPYVHAKPPLAEGTLGRRLATTDDSPYALTEADATLAITTLLRLVQRHPFSPVA